MKVWIAIYFDREVSAHFVGVGATKEAAQKATDMNGRAFWKDNDDGTESVLELDDFSGYRVYETDVIE